MNRKTAPMNGTQKQLLTDFMKNHEQLAKGKFSNTFTFKKAQCEWEEVTNMLNGVPNGSKKEWKQWRKTWTDIKKNTKHKAAEIKRYAKQTGGGPPPNELNAIENDIITIIGSVSQEGHSNISETNVEFSFEEDQDVQELLLSTITSDAGSSGQVLFDDMDNTSFEVIDSKETESVTPKIRDDHCYSKKTESSRKRKITKSKRFENSLQINNNLLSILKDRKSVEESYYREKIEFLKYKKVYYEQKIKLMGDMLNTVKILKLCYRIVNLFPYT